MFNKLFGKTKTPEQKLADDLKARSQKLWREINAGEARRNQIGEIYTVLKECYDTFEKSIILENSRAYQLQHDGFDITQQRNRVREAAIGMLVSKEAMIRVRDISSEEDLANALNQLGVTLKQIQRLDSTTKSISGSTRKILEKWYPYPLEDTAARGGYETLTVPQEIKNRIDERFLTNLMNGVSFDNCIQYAKLHSEEAQNARKSKMDAELEAMEQVLGRDDDPLDEKKLDDKYDKPF